MNDRGEIPRWFELHLPRLARFVVRACSEATAWEEARKYGLQNPDLGYCFDNLMGYGLLGTTSELPYDRQTSFNNAHQGMPLHRVVMTADYRSAGHLMTPSRQDSWISPNQQLDTDEQPTHEQPQLPKEEWAAYEDAHLKARSAFLDMHDDLSATSVA